MISLKLDKERMFFDREAVIAAVGKAKAGVMARGGGYIRTIAQRSMRYRNKPSQPGTPPSAHKAGTKGAHNQHRRGPLLRKFLYSAFDEVFESVVVGPEGLRGSKHPVPELQEYGGITPIKIRLTPPKKKPARVLSPAQKAAYRAKVLSGAIVPPKALFVTKAIRLPARPFMEPALNKALPKLTGLWADSVKP